MLNRKQRASPPKTSLDFINNQECATFTADALDTLQIARAGWTNAALTLEKMGRAGELAGAPAALAALERQIDALCAELRDVEL